MKNLTAIVNPKSPSFGVTINRALRISQYFESNLHIVSTTSLPPTSEKKMESDLEVLKEHIAQHLGKQHHNIEISYEVGYGPIIPMLQEMLKSNKTDLAVIGTSSSNNLLYRYLFEKDSIDVAQALSCPVLLVPPNDVNRRIKRIVYTTEFTFEDINALNVLEDWASIFKAELMCLHVCKSEDDVPQAEKKLEVLAQRFTAINFHYKIVVGKVVHKIYQHIALEDTDLIVGLHKKKSWWAQVLRPSITERVAETAKIPMLIFKEK